LGTGVVDPWGRGLWAIEFMAHIPRPQGATTPVPKAHHKRGADLRPAPLIHIITFQTQSVSSHELDDNFHRCITLTGSDLYDTGISTVTVCVLGSDLIKELVSEIDLL